MNDPKRPARATDDGAVIVDVDAALPMSPERAEALAAELVKQAAVARDRAHWTGITVPQLAWYVACCEVDTDEQDVEWLVRMLRTRPPLESFPRQELIKMAVRFNEDHENAARRLRESLRLTPDGWPAFTTSDGVDP
jgi:hypothetical protein